MRRSKISQLPQEVLDALNAKLIGSDFSGYAGLAEWLTGQGYAISRSALHRHGAELEAEFEAAMADARRARALARASREAEDADDGALLEAAAGIMQDSLLRASLKLKQGENGDPAETAKTLSLISRAFADVGRFDLSRQKWQAEIEANARKKLIEEQREKLSTLGKSGAAPAEVLAKVIKAAYDL
ncbi:MAG: DUF3486 family protein [Zoogloeaceae bacterium]|jgi:hypothetical protein|nr:DUF3486 family protein [Zoogloeaceae bacterium]